MTTYTVTPEQVSAAKLQLVLDKAVGRDSSDWTRSVADAKSSPRGADAGSLDEKRSGHHTIKGNADSMLFHTSDSPHYDRTQADVWFADEDAARAAGFKHWDHRKK
jgi:hypothetical protein